MLGTKYPFETELQVGSKELTVQIDATVLSFAPFPIVEFDSAVLVAVDGRNVVPRNVLRFLGGIHFAYLRQDIAQLTHDDDHEEAVMHNSLINHYGDYYAKSIYPAGSGHLSK